MKKREKNLEAYTCTETLHVGSHITTCMTQTQHYCEMERFWDGTAVEIRPVSVTS